MYARTRTYIHTHINQSLTNLHSQAPANHSTNSQGICTARNHHPIHTHVHMHIIFAYIEACQERPKTSSPSQDMLVHSKGLFLLVLEILTQPSRIKLRLCRWLLYFHLICSKVRHDSVLVLVFCVCVCMYVSIYMYVCMYVYEYACDHEMA